jgi:hypothetical protein
MSRRSGRETRVFRQAALGAASKPPNNFALSIDRRAK